MPFLFCFFLFLFLCVLFSVFKPSWGPKERLMKNNHPCLDSLAKGLIPHRAIPSGRVFSRYIAASPAFVHLPPALPHVRVSVAALIPGTTGPQPAPRVAVQRLTCTNGGDLQVVASCTCRDRLPCLLLSAGSAASVLVVLQHPPCLFGTATAPSRWVLSASSLAVRMPSSDLV